MPLIVNIQRFCSWYCIESSDACNNINVDASHSRLAELLVSLPVALENLVAEAGSISLLMEESNYNKLSPALCMIDLL
jgi:hypothetical protein